MIIRRLDGTDAAAFRALRLHGLQESPASFGSSYEEALAQPLERMAERLRHAPERPHDFVLGAFDRDLIGLVGFARETRAKTRHKGSIWGMYVAEQARGRGIGRALLQGLLGEARTQPGLEAITLLVVSTNEAAKRIYRSFGFAIYGTEPLALKLGDRYYDEDLMVLRL
jgi:ribosomal protein S18 acetylase RimI-like enzyme